MKPGVSTPRQLLQQQQQRPQKNPPRRVIYLIHRNLIPLANCWLLVVFTWAEEFVPWSWQEACHRVNRTVNVKPAEWLPPSQRKKTAGSDNTPCHRLPAWRCSGSGGSPTENTLRQIKLMVLAAEIAKPNEWRWACTTGKRSDDKTQGSSYFADETGNYCSEPSTSEQYLNNMCTTSIFSRLLMLWIKCS